VITRRIFFVLYLSAPAIAGQDAEPVYDLTEEITPPRITHKVNPEPGPNAHGVRIVGSVIIGLVVTSEGLPRDVHIVKSLEKSVDESAVLAVKQWRFSPATKDKKPVAVRISFELEFNER
jgi:TonB family protein